MTTIPRWVSKYSPYSPEGTIESVLVIEANHRTKNSYDYQGCDKHPCGWCIFIREHSAYKMEELGMDLKEGQRKRRDLGYICLICAESKGGVWPRGAMIDKAKGLSWHHDTCNHCKSHKSLTAWYNWNWPNNPIRNKEAKKMRGI